MFSVLRALLWVCARVQLCLEAAQIPPILALRPSPDELAPELRPFFEQSAQTLRTLSIERNRIARARRSDPDVYFGYLRTTHYRRAIVEAHRSLQSWLESTQGPLHRRGHSSLPNSPTNWPAGPRSARKTLQLMQRHVWQAQHGRALEPFALDEVMAIERALDSFSDKLRATMDLMVQSRGIGYRNAAWTPPPAHAPQAKPARARSKTRIPKVPKLPAPEAA